MPFRMPPPSQSSTAMSSPSPPTLPSSSQAGTLRLPAPPLPPKPLYLTATRSVRGLAAQWDSGSVSGGVDDEEENGEDGGRGRGRESRTGKASGRKRAGMPRWSVVGVEQEDKEDGDEDQGTVKVRGGAGRAEGGSEAREKSDAAAATSALSLFFPDATSSTANDDDKQIDGGGSGTFHTPVSTLRLRLPPSGVGAGSRASTIKLRAPDGRMSIYFDATRENPFLPPPASSSSFLPPPATATATEELVLPPPSPTSPSSSLPATPSPSPLSSSPAGADSFELTSDLLLPIPLSASPAVALHAFAGQSDFGELSFAAGEALRIEVEDLGGGWSLGWRKVEGDEGRGLISKGWYAYVDPPVSLPAAPISPPIPAAKPDNEQRTLSTPIIASALVSSPESTYTSLAPAPLPFPGEPSLPPVPLDLSSFSSPSSPSSDDASPSSSSPYPTRSIGRHVVVSGIEFEPIPGTPTAPSPVGFTIEGAAAAGEEELSIEELLAIEEARGANGAEEEWARLAAEFGGSPVAVVLPLQTIPCEAGDGASEQFGLPLVEGETQEEEDVAKPDLLSSPSTPPPPSTPLRLSLLPPASPPLPPSTPFVPRSLSRAPSLPRTPPADVSSSSTSPPFAPSPSRTPPPSRPAPPSSSFLFRLGLSSSPSSGFSLPLLLPLPGRSTIPGASILAQTGASPKRKRRLPRLEDGGGGGGAGGGGGKGKELVLRWVREGDEMDERVVEAMAKVGEGEEADVMQVGQIWDVDAGPAWRPLAHSPLVVQVYSPEKHTPAVGSAYTTYAFTTYFPSSPSSSSPSSSPVPITVHRRFSHFTALHALLSSRFLAPLISIPPLPPKQLGLARFDKVFVEGRRRELERWLERVGGSEVLGGCEELRGFLEIEEEEDLIQHLLLSPPLSSSSSSLPLALFPARVFHPEFNLDLEEATELVDRFERYCVAVEVGGGWREVERAVRGEREGRRVSATSLQSLSHSLIRLSAGLALPPASYDRSFLAGVNTAAPINETELARGQRRARAWGVQSSEGGLGWREEDGDSLALAKAMQLTAETLANVADMQDETTRTALLDVQTLLHDHSSPLSQYSPLIDLHRSLLSLHAHLSSLPSTELTHDALARCETALNITCAEMERIGVERREDLRRAVEGWLEAVMQGMEQSLAHLRYARSHFAPSPLASLALTGPRLRSLLEARPPSSYPPLPQPSALNASAVEVLGAVGAVGSTFISGAGGGGGVAGVGLGLRRAKTTGGRVQGSGVAASASGREEDGEAGRAGAGFGDEVGAVAEGGKEVGGRVYWGR